MKIKKSASFVVVLLIVSLSCNFLFPNSQSHVPDINNIGQSVANLPLLDPESPLPSPGATQLRTLVADEPGIAPLINDVEAAEQAAMKAAVADLHAKLGPTSNIPNIASLESTPIGTSAYLIPSSATQSTYRDLLLVSYNQSSVMQASDGGLSGAEIIGSITSMFTDTFAVPGAMPTKSSTKTEKEGNVTTDMSMEIGRAEDGSSHFVLGLKSEGTENGVSVKTDMSSTIDGQRCPTSDGQVSFSIKARLGSEVGGTGTTQDLTTFVRATVNDDAEIASSTFDVIQGTTQIKDGRQLYFESGETIKYGQDYKGAKESNWRVNQKTDNVTHEDMDNLQPAGFKAAMELGLSSLLSARRAWQSGGCTKIVATSPGTVKVDSTTAVPVNVISIFDGSNAPSKLKAALTGAESIDPTSLATTPGTLSYTAPNENGKSATILLTATSKRGKAKLELTANTGGSAYHISGALGDMGLEEGNACDLTKPFTLHGPVTMVFTPADEKSGSFKFADGPFADRGAGPYTIGNGSLVIGGSGCVDTQLGTFCNQGSLTFTATPIDPSSCVP